MPKNTTFPPAAPATEQPFIPSKVKDGYVKPSDLTPYAKTADVMAKAASISGYDATKTQTLTNDKGTLKWVNNASE